VNPSIFLKNCGVHPRPVWPWLRPFQEPFQVTFECGTSRGTGICHVRNGVYHVTNAVVYPRDKQTSP